MEKFGIFKFADPILGDKWIVGWLTGRDGDLICIRPNIADWWEGEVLHSPVCTHPFLAVVAFLLKWWLASLDRNMQKTWSGNLSYDELIDDDG